MDKEGYVNFLIKLLSFVLLRPAERKKFRANALAAWRNEASTEVDIMTIVETLQSTRALHEKAFAEFRGASRGKRVVVVATGPSLSRFVPIPDAVYIGVNNAFRCERTPLDFLFAQDYAALKNSMREMNAYREGKCVKFYGLTRELERAINLVIPESDVERAHARRYRTIWWPLAKDGEFKERFAYDLCAQPLASFESVVFPALQFALWLEPSEIYLVGCDCSGQGHAGVTRSVNSCEDCSVLIESYVRFREFASRYYPKTKIISVNPVGLRGVFSDLFQDSLIEKEKNA